MWLHNSQSQKPVSRHEAHVFQCPIISQKWYRKEDLKGGRRQVHPTCYKQRIHNQGSCRQAKRHYFRILGIQKSGCYTYEVSDCILLLRGRMAPHTQYRYVAARSYHLENDCHAPPPAIKERGFYEYDIHTFEI